MKKNILFRTGAVCKLALLLFAALIMTACDNGEDPDPIVIPPDEEDTRVKEVWAKNSYWNDELFHSLTLTFYPEEGYFYVKQTPYIDNVNLFGSDYNVFYEIRNDTMYLRELDEAEFDYERDCCKYRVQMHLPDTMYLHYIGNYPHNMSPLYRFIRQN